MARGERQGLPFPEQALTTQVAEDANLGPSSPSSKRASVSFPELAGTSPARNRSLSLKAPEAFTWPKVHAHRAQLGLRARGACSLRGPRVVHGWYADSQTGASRPWGSAQAA